MKKYILLLVLYLVIYPGAYAQWDIYVAKYKDNKKSAISYTFDDGLVEHYSLVMPKFRDLSFSGTFWINGSKIGRASVGERVCTACVGSEVFLTY